jgi:hypothetical protein
MLLQKRHHYFKKLILEIYLELLQGPLDSAAKKSLSSVLNRGIFSYHKTKFRRLQDNLFNLKKIQNFK